MEPLSIGANTLTVNGSITKSSGTLTGGSSSNITIGGSGAATGLPAVTLNNLTLNRANGISLTGDVSVEGTLALSDGWLNLNNQTLSIGNSGSISGTPSASKHIMATSGTLRKNFASTGSFNYPVGDGTNYTPINLNFTSGSFASAYAEVDLTTSKHPNNSSSSHYISRYWTVSSSGISGFNCNITATYADGDISGTESELVGGKWDGSWSNLGDVTDGSNLITGSVSSFSDITAGEAATFPVEWLHFDALLAGNDVMLDWATASEQNSDYFGVERTSDKQVWEEIGQVEAAQYSDSRRDYTFMDTKAPEGKMYYRLRQVDLDGTFSYSNTIEIDRNALIRLYPNPVKNNLNIDLPGSNWMGELFDIQGKKIAEFPVMGDQLDMKAFPAGRYLLRLRSPEGKYSGYSIIKE